jgi:uncharacterized membrane protein YGL010W
MSMFDFEKQLVFYGSYHSHRINVLCHIICVPLIMWSAFVLGNALGLQLELGTGILSKLPIPLNFPVFVAILYAAYYMTLEPLAGVSTRSSVRPGLPSSVSD